MSERTLYDKVWDKHKVTTLPTGQDQLLIGLHLVHEVTSPQAFAGLKERGSRVAFPNRTFATLDHIIPTTSYQRPYLDSQAETMVSALENNLKDFGIQYFGPESGKLGIVHVIGPELGLTQPGMTIVCGDSHTSSHGAFGSLAFGIGTSEVELVLETGTLALNRLNVRRINVDGQLNKGVYAKDVILSIIRKLSVKGGIGFAYEYGGDVFDGFSMEERLTVCNMSIEGGARMGYVNPDQTTFDYMKGRPYAPKEDDWDKAMDYWTSIQSETNAVYDDVVQMQGQSIEPMVTWGIHPGHSVAVTETIPDPDALPQDERDTGKKALDYMKFKPNSPIKGQPVNVVFIGSCTNSRLSDMREAAKILQDKTISSNVKAIVVPGSQQVKEACEKEGLHEIFTASGAEWRNAGCSMCLAMNPDKLSGDQVCASTSNRNYMGRQGSPTGRTLLMSPAMAAAAAVAGEVVDVREWTS